MALFLGIDTEIKWIEDISDIPVLGHLFLFALVFVPVVILSFILQAIVPALSNDVGFTKSMLILLPLWNIGLWLRKVKVYIIFIPSWIILGVISTIKGYLMFRGIDDGQ